MIALCYGLSAHAQTDSVSYTLTGIENKGTFQRYFSRSAITQKPGFRILHFGDSHIQADRITGEIRKSLQEETGNGGSGLFFPYALCGSFGPSGTKSEIKGGYSWSTFLKNPDDRSIGILGYEITFKPGAQLSMSFGDDFRGRPSNEISIWIHSSIDSIHIEAGPDLKPIGRDQINPSLYVYRFSSDSVIRTIAFRAKAVCALWGMEFKQRTGLIYQQCGLVGAQFTHLIRFKEDYRDQLLAMKPDLIIFSYGTNESYGDIDSNSYRKQVKAYVDEIKRMFPDAGFLISNAPDTRSAGRIPASEQLVNSILSRVATDSEVPFFDLFRAMGGWGSLYRWDSKGLFQIDQLHFNPEGSVLIGRLFTYALFDVGGFAVERTNAIRNDLVQRMTDVLSAGRASKDPVDDPQKPDRDQEGQRKRRVYVVKSGDTLSQIAIKTKRGVKELVRINKLKSPDKISKGQKIYY